MPLTLSPPSAELITLVEARLQCSIDPDITKWDPLLTTAIQAARQRAEHITQRLLAPRTARLTLDAFPCGDFSLEASPVRAIEAITYIDSAGLIQTVPTLTYILDDVSDPPCVLLAADASWPTASGANSVRVDMQVGYTAADTIFPDVKAWMLLQVGTIFRNRELFSQGVPIHELPANYTERLLDSARIWV
jgi:uncharacterized phiE125 gp8 family phage protein